MATNPSPASTPIPSRRMRDALGSDAQRKIFSGLFFAIVSINVGVVGDVWECDVASACMGNRQAAVGDQRQRARRVKGSAQGREIVLHPPRVFPFIAPVCRTASPVAMAAAIATLSERNPARIGITSRTSAAACTLPGTPDEFAAEQQDIAAAKCVIEIGRACARGEQKHSRVLGLAPLLERLPIGVARDLDFGEVIHPGAAECAVRGRKSCWLDDVRLDSKTGGEAKYRPRVLGYVGLEKRDLHGLGRGSSGSGDVGEKLRTEKDLCDFWSWLHRPTCTPSARVPITVANR